MGSQEHASQVLPSARSIYVKYFLCLPLSAIRYFSSPCSLLPRACYFPSPFSSEIAKRRLIVCQNPRGKSCCDFADSRGLEERGKEERNAKAELFLRRRGGKELAEAKRGKAGKKHCCMSNDLPKREKKRLCVLAAAVVARASGNESLLVVGCVGRPLAASLRRQKRGFSRDIVLLFLVPRIRRTKAFSIYSSSPRTSRTTTMMLFQSSQPEKVTNIFLTMCELFPLEPSDAHLALSALRSAVHSHRNALAVSWLFAHVHPFFRFERR